MGAKVLFLVPYPLGESPSQRFRFEQYFSILTASGIQYKVSTFLSSHNWQVFFKAGGTWSKILALFSGFLLRLNDLLRARNYDFIFIHREAAPLGPPLIEWLLSKVFRKKIIYDFDDAIWITDKHRPSRIESALKCRRKVRSIIRWSYKVSCSNDYLARYASAYNKRVICNPTTIDTEHTHNPALYSPLQKNESRIVIGWTGSHSTLKYLTVVEGVISSIQTRYPEVEFVVIADRQPNIAIPHLKFIKWNIESEIRDLMTLDIGIMPLPDDDWTKGKGGFKCLQYMALQIPAVVSPVGVNKTLIEHGTDGFLADTPEDWQQYLIRLVQDKSLRLRMGNAGRKKVEGNYSVRSNTPSFLSLFE